MRHRRRGFTLVELLIVVVIVGILALASVPALLTNTEDARSAEARAAIGLIRDRARIAVARQGLNNTDPGPQISDLGVGDGLDGAYFNTSDYWVSGQVDNYNIACANAYSEYPWELRVRVDLKSNQIIEDFTR